MTTWAIATIIVLAGLAATLVALFTGGFSQARGPREPDWLVPSPVEVRRARFPVSWRGYDPGHVDVYLDALAAAYEELYFAAGPTAAARARERLALRLGRVTARAPTRTPAPELDQGVDDEPTSPEGHRGG
ncbi:MAG: DivIVA domain-containing protein [Actinobacteria bacterium]|nr:DivIVA domain-containing protein [Actinomycetota bacterium]